MLYTRVEGHQSSGFEEEVFLKDVTIHGHGSSLGHMTRTV